MYKILFILTSIAFGLVFVCSLFSIGSHVQFSDGKWPVSTTYRINFKGWLTK